MEFIHPNEMFPGPLVSTHECWIYVLNDCMHLVFKMQLSEEYFAVLAFDK